MGAPSLGALIILVVVSSVVTGVCLGTVLLHLYRRRVARVTMAAMDLSGEAVNVMVARGIKEAADQDEHAVLGLNRSPSRLYKTREGCISPVRPTPLPVLPPLFARRASFNPFANGGSGNNKTPARSRSHGSRRANAAWIDEDALHGPQVRRGGCQGEAEGEDGEEGGGSRRNRRLLVRSSWPLNMSPTLPRLENDDQGEDEAWRRADDGGGELRPVLGPRQLPDPPKPAMRHSTGGPQRSLSRRNPSTDSTLSEILRNTERRIQEGTMTGVARRNRAAGGSASSSPSKTVTAAVSKETLVGVALSAESSTATLMHVDSLGRRTPSPTKSAGPVTTPQYARSTTLMHVDSLGRRTPSPTKSAGPVTTPQYARSHRHEASQSSLVSDLDSLYGDIDQAVQDTRPVPDVAVGPTSPSRSETRRREAEQEQQRQLQRERSTSRPRSMGSSASSALSTVYSEEEPVEGNINTSASRPASSLGWQSWSFFPVPGQTVPNLGRPGDDDPFCTDVRRSTASLVVASPSSIKSYKSPITVIPGLTLLQPGQRQVAQDRPHTTPTKARCGPPYSRNASSSPTLGRLSLHEQAVPYFPKPLALNASQPPGLVRASSTSSSTYSQEAGVVSGASSPRHGRPARHVPLPALPALSYAQEVTALRSRSSVFLDEYNVEAPAHGLRLPTAPGSLPLVSAVAELRRMNSAASTTDHWNYLAVGNTARWSTTTPRGQERMSRRLSVVIGGARDDSDSDGGEGHDSGKENREAPAVPPAPDAMPLKMPRVDFSRDLPALARLKAGSRTSVASVESNGLYDQDGFLKSSPVRTGRR